MKRKGRKERDAGTRKNRDLFGWMENQLTSPLNPRLLLMTALSPHPVTALELESLVAALGAGCGATSSAALQPKRVGSKRSAARQQLEAAAAPTPQWWQQPGAGATIGHILSQLHILWRKTHHMQPV